MGQILEEARKIAERSLPRDGDHLRKLADDTENMAASLAEMRSNGQGTRYTSPYKRDGFCLFHNTLDYQCYLFDIFPAIAYYESPVFEVGRFLPRS